MDWDLGTAFLTKVMEKYGDSVLGLIMFVVIMVVVYLVVIRPTNKQRTQERDRAAQADEQHVLTATALNQAAHTLQQVGEQQANIVEAMKATSESMKSGIAAAAGLFRSIERQSDRLERLMDREYSRRAERGKKTEGSTDEG